MLRRKAYLFVALLGDVLENLNTVFNVVIFIIIIIIIEVVLFVVCINHLNLF